MTYQSPLTIFINIKDFPYNAKGDGIADDTVSIQTAINAASVASPAQAQIYLPTGTYKTTAPLIGNSNIILRGDGVTSVIKATGTGAALSVTSNSNFRFENFQIDASSGASITDGIYLVACQQVVIRGVMVNGGSVGCTRGGITFDGTGGINCYAVHITGSVIQTCVGDGINCVASSLTHEFTCDGRSVIQDNGGWGYRNTNNGIASAVECVFHGVLFESNSLGEVTGSFWGSSFEHCHFETVSSGAGSPFKMSGSVKYQGLRIVGNFFENHQSGAAGNYCVELNPSISSQALVIEGNFFDLYRSAAIYIGAHIRGRIGPNQYNGTAFDPYPPVNQGGLSIADGVLPPTDTGFQQQDVMRIFANDYTSIFENNLTKTGLQTSGTATATFDLTIAAPTFGLASAFTGLLDYKATVMGIDLGPIGGGATDGYYWKGDFEATYFNTAGSIVMVPTSGTVTATGVLQYGGVVGTVPTLTLNGTNARITVAGVSGRVWVWGVTYTAKWCI